MSSLADSLLWLFLARASNPRTWLRKRAYSLVQEFKLFLKFLFWMLILCFLWKIVEE
jgi:hypothetical protein